MLKSNKDSLVVFIVMLVVFSSFTLNPNSYTDMPAHIHFAKLALEDGTLLRGNFLMYLILNILTLFSRKRILISIALLFLLSAANTAKYLIAKIAFEDFTNVWIAKIASLSLLFVFVIPWLFPQNKLMYLGYCVPNVWHNSTIVLSMPFAILMYLYSLKILSAFSEKNNNILTIVTLICVLIKPSFFFVFGVVYPIMLLIKYGVSKTLFKALLPVLIGALGCMYIYFSIFTIGNQTGGNGVMISANKLLCMDFWREKLPFLISSLAFPILFCVFDKNSIKTKEFLYLSLMIVTALLISYLCSETGDRAGHGNFGWQIVPVMWLVYYSVLKGILSWKQSAKRNFFLSIYSIHVVVGIVYCMRLVLFDNYA